MIPDQGPRSTTLRTEPANTATDGNQEDELARVLDAYLAEVEAGRPTDPQEWVNRHPAIAQRLRACLKGLHLVAAAADAFATAETAETAATADDDSPRLGDFRILRELGRGGMGVVYEAEQRSLGRRVALKVLPFAAAIDPRQIARFRVEAQAASQLHQPHIVSIYSVGCERGVHYYAMQIIDGPTLAEVIAELRHRAGDTATPQPAPTGSPGGPKAGNDHDGPRIESTGLTPASGWSLASCSRHSRTFFHEVARLGFEAAEALDHAHQQGVLHRDVKPSNLIVDGRGHLWVTDFGLARFQGEASLTATGDLLGTLRYMSPEQALANRAVVDQRTDVYSLGATLYELLALCPAIEGTDRQELLRRIALEEPRRLCALNPAVPRDLETIVLKAMAKDPVVRYTTAQELADDLHRFRDDQPILGRRPGPLERASRWTRRHVAVVLAVVPLLAVMVLGLAVGIVLVLAKQAEIRGKQVQVERSQAEARNQRDEARRAVNTMYTQVAEAWLERQTNLQPLQRDFLIKALAYYEAFALDNDADPAVRAEAGEASLRVGEIQRKLGRPVEAERAYRQAITTLQTVVGQVEPLTGPDAQSHSSRNAPTDVLEALAKSYGGLGELLSETSRSDEALQALRRAAELTQALVGATPNTPSGHPVLAARYQRLGTLLRLSGRLSEAEAAYRKAIEHNQASGESRRLKQAGTYADLGIVLTQTGRSDEAQQSYRRAAELYEVLVKGDPGMPLYRRELAGTLLNLGVLLWNDPGGIPEAEQAFRRALALYQRLSADAPGVTQFRQELAVALLNLGNLLGATGRAGEAEPLLHQAVETREALVADLPDHPGDRSELALAQSRLATLVAARGDCAQARKLLEHAIDNQQQALRLSPGDPAGRQRLHDQREALIGVLIRLGTHARAAAVAEELLRDGAADHRDTTPAFVATFLTSCAALAARDQTLNPRDGKRAALAYARRARDLLRNAAAPGGGDPAAPFHLAWFLTSCPVVELRDPPEAVRIARTVVDRAPGSWITWATLGAALYRTDDWTGALEALEHGADLNRGSIAFYGFFMAMAYHRLNLPDRARSCFDETDRWLQTMPWDEAALRLRAEAAALIATTPSETPESSPN
jgi:serine/threonine protein kinase/tetratricopeptide (TPR) repeat protein